MNLRVRRAASPPPDTLRRRRLAALSEPQELYLEGRVAAASTWLIERGGELAGYAVVEDSGTLLELFCEGDAGPVVQELVAAAHVTGSLCHSFDQRMIALVAPAFRESRPIGILFRSIADRTHQSRHDASVRPAHAADVRAIAGIDDDFFTDEEEIGRYLEIGGLFVLESSAGAVMGCGVAEPAIPGSSAVDIGMMVGPAFRRRGYGRFIVSYLKADLLSRGLRPVCGCAIDNIASRKSIEAAGFVADHRLLLFEHQRTD